MALSLKRYLTDTHRCDAPEETIARVQTLASAMGITRVANVTGLDRIGIPVVMVVRPNARSIAVSQGKGLGLETAKASGLMEAVELYHAENIQQPLRLARYDELKATTDLIDVDGLARPATSRFRSNRSLLWIEGEELFTERLLWLPYECVHVDYAMPPPTGSGCFDSNSNGLASGNHRLEALAHGICELVERDATTLWNQLDPERREATRLALDTVDDGNCQEVLAKLREADFSVAVWDITSDIAVPAFYALVIDRRSEAEHLGIGAGCHLDRGIALLRALTEAVQVRMTYITGARDDLTPFEYSRAGRAQKLLGAGLLTQSKRATRDFRALPSKSFPTFDEDIAWLLERLRAVGLQQVVTVDLTQSAFGLAVVRVVIPGLEGLDGHPDYRPGPRAARQGGWAT